MGEGGRVGGNGEGGLGTQVRMRLSDGGAPAGGVGELQLPVGARQGKKRSFIICLLLGFVLV